MRATCPSHPIYLETKIWVPVVFRNYILPSLWTARNYILPSLWTARNYILPSLWTAQNYILPSLWTAPNLSKQ